MKKIFGIVVLLLTAIMAFSQQYQCVYPNITSIFSDGTEINAIRLDSVTSETGCQVLWNYPVLRPASEEMIDWCFSDHGGSWVGRKFRVYPNGDHVFYNISGSPITLKTRAILNESWVCYERSDLKIRATVNNIAVETFFGLTDSVKTISLQALDTDGNAISHDINSKQFKISKSYGFVKLVSLYVFPDIHNDYIPDSANQFTLSGLSSPLAGNQNLTARDCYNFEMNDELHTIYRGSDWGSGNLREIKAIKLLKSKTFSLNLDTLNLTWDICSRETLSYGGSDTNYFFNGEITEQVIFSQIELGIDKLPGGIISLEGWNNYNRAYNEMYGKPCKTLFGGFYSIPDDTCVRMYVIKKSSGTVSFGYPDKAYVEGLGGGYYFNIDFYSELYQLVYWKKGTEEWGTPYTCSELLGETEIDKTRGLTIFPNPANDKVQIKLASGNIKCLMIFDFSGRKIIEKELNCNDYILSVNGLEAGVYFVVINNQIRNRFVKQ
jgi:hypothetical protein